MMIMTIVNQQKKKEHLKLFLFHSVQNTSLIQQLNNTPNIQLSPLVMCDVGNTIWPHKSPCCVVIKNQMVNLDEITS